MRHSTHPTVAASASRPRTISRLSEASGPGSSARSRRAAGPSAIAATTAAPPMTPATPHRRGRVAAHVTAAPDATMRTSGTASVASYSPSGTGSVTTSRHPQTGARRASAIPRATPPKPSVIAPGMATTMAAAR
ncbi:hypothetical protein [Demequina sediminis]|uniref:hypothetical protein n=1 Tax=Demequina sediminis TaxID=1930058 RepID=UPI002572755A|nr:hypothetical protein [Demequina sediminis]